MFWYYFHDPSANGARARGFQSWHIKFFSLWKIPLFFNFARISTLGNFTTFFDLWIQGYNLVIFQIFLNPPLNNSQKSKLKGIEQKKSCWWPSGPSWRRVLLKPPPGVYQRPYYPWPIGLKDMDVLCTSKIEISSTRLQKGPEGHQQFFFAQNPSVYSFGSYWVVN